MIFLMIALGIGAAIATYGTALFPFGVVTAVAAFWGNGIMANFSHSPQEAPNYAALLSMLAAAASVILIISGIIGLLAV